MDLGPLSKISLIIFAASVIAVVSTVMISRKHDEYVLNRLEGLDQVVNKSIPQGKFTGLNISSFDHLVDGENIERSKFLYKAPNTRGVNGLIPPCFYGLDISEISIPQDGGVLYLWYLDKNQEIIWDAYIANGLTF